MVKSRQDHVKNAHEPSSPGTFGLGKRPPKNHTSEFGTLQPKVRGVRQIGGPQRGRNTAQEKKGGGLLGLQGFGLPAADEPFPTTHNSLLGGSVGSEEEAAGVD